MRGLLGVLAFAVIVFAVFRLVYAVRVQVQGDPTGKGRTVTHFRIATQQSNKDWVECRLG